MSENISSIVLSLARIPVAAKQQLLRSFGKILALVLLSSAASTLAGGKPEIDPSYADGKVYYMIGARLITNANPHLYAASEELYLLTYPVNPTGSATLGTITLPSGYRPLCDPCFHPGLPLQFAYHDHVLTGAPGLGTGGTAGQYKAPWKLIVLMYKPAVAMSPTFKPITSAADIDAAEAAGEFLPINQDPAAANPYEIDTGNVLICPLVSPHA